MKHCFRKTFPNNTFQKKFRCAFEVVLGKDPGYKFCRFLHNVISATDQNCPVFQKAKVKYEI